MATQAKGINAKTIIDFEDTYGSDPGAPDAKTVPFNSNTLKQTVALNTAATITGRRDQTKPFRGNAPVDGEIAVPVDVRDFPYWLTAMFGAPTTTGAGPYVHTFKVGDTQPSLVIERQFPDLDTPQYFKYNGCKIDAMSITAGGDGELTSSLTIAGATETVSGTSYDATPTTQVFERFENFGGGIYINDVSFCDATEFTFTLNAGLDKEIYTICDQGSAQGTRRSLPEGTFAVTGQITALFDSMTEYNKAVNFTETSLELRFTQGAHILKFKFEECVYEKQSPEVTGPNGILLTLPFTAYFADGSNDSIVTVEVTNDVATYTA